MCGFCGYVDQENITNEDNINKMNNALKKEHSSVGNIFIDKNVAFGACSLSSPTQPMSKLEKKSIYTILFNGEIYNKDELKDDVLSKGYSLDTDLDEELILTLYIEYGKDLVDMLNGIFAFAIYDRASNCIFFARDRLGIKPLFFTNVAKPYPQFIFSSEIKAILAHENVNAILDKKGIMELFGLGPAHTPGKTFFKDIFEIKPGHRGFLMGRYI